jgi:hypothetical protein
MNKILFNFEESAVTVGEWSLDQISLDQISLDQKCVFFTRSKVLFSLDWIFGDFSLDRKL